MTNTTSAPKEQPNQYIAEIKEFFEPWKAGEQYGFGEMLEYLLSKTVVKPGSTMLKKQLGKNGKNFNITGQVLKHSDGADFMPLELNDGRYLDVKYNMIIEDGAVHTVASKIQYMQSRDGKGEIFRYDYERNTATPYPSAHLHVYGQLPEGLKLSGLSRKGKEKSLHHIHYPVVRPSLESVIRLLINDYGVRSNIDEPALWAALLDYTERRFFEVMRPERGEEAHPPYAVEKA